MAKRLSVYVYDLVIEMDCKTFIAFYSNIKENDWSAGSAKRKFYLGCYEAKFMGFAIKCRMRTA